MPLVSHDKEEEETDQRLPTRVYGSEAGGWTRRLLWVWKFLTWRGERALFQQFGT